MTDTNFVFYIFLVEVKAFKEIFFTGRIVKVFLLLTSSLDTGVLVTPEDVTECLLIRLFWGTLGRGDFTPQKIKISSPIAGLLEFAFFDIAKIYFQLGSPLPVLKTLGFQVFHGTHRSAAKFRVAPASA